MTIQSIAPELVACRREFRYWERNDRSLGLSWRSFEGVGKRKNRDARDNTLDGMYLPAEKAGMVLRLLLEGDSVSSVVRLADVHQKTILKLLVLAR